MAARRALVRGLWWVLVIGVALSACGRTRLDLYEDGGAWVDGGFADSGRDAGNEAGLDSGRDGGLDSGRDGGLEAGVDGGPLCRGCDDGVSCTVDTCDPATGECRSVPNSARCESGQVCVPGVGCQVVPCGLDDRCDDGIFCNGAEQCVNGLCAGGGVVRCPSDRCNVGFCDEGVRACLSRPVDSDGDGFGPFECMGGDCDDSDLRVSPAAPEICNDRRDNNCDLAVDCADSNCANTDVCVPPPPREANCSNRIDDDRDGAIDCADGDCAMTPVCVPPPPRETNCNNRIDDDMDGRLDCADGDCAMNPVCLATTCPTIDVGTRQGRLASGTTVGGRSERSPPCLGNAHIAPEVTHLWRAPQAGTWIIDTEGSDYDTALYVLAGACNGALLACNDDAIGPLSQVSLGLSAGQTVVIVVDGFSSDAGNYVLNARLVGPGSEFGFCADGRDNDNDGRADCDDPDCQMDPDCFMPQTEAGQCFDGVDNDGDGAVDCFDFDCFGDPFCMVVRSERGLCGDNFDNDMDGRADCADSDCLNDPLCVMVPVCPDSDLGSATGSPVVSDTTSGRGDDFVPNCTSFNSGAPDVAYRWRAPSAGRWAFDTIGSSYDTALSVMRTCSGPVLACNDDISGGNLASQVTLPLVGGEEVILVVDGWGESVGRYVVNINRIVTNERGLCADMLDNDGDGALDCADSDCANDVACQPPCDPSESGLAACTDGQDNDCDGLPDCADSECTSPGGNECCNGVDDNGDGAIDLLACGCDSADECGPIQTQFGPLPGTCWRRTRTCGPDCSAFSVDLGNTICRIINPAWRCQRATGQCVPAP